MGIFLTVLIVGVILFAIGLLYNTRPERLDEALAHYKNAEINEALNLLKEEVEDDPESHRAHFYLAKIYEQVGKPDLMVKHLEQVRKIGRFSEEIQALDVQKKIADVLYMRGKLQDALGAYLEVASLAPDDETANSRIGLMAMAEGQFRVAELYLQKARASDPKNKQYQKALAVAYFQLNNHEKAFENIENLLEQDPDNQDLNLLYIMMSQKSHFKSAAEKIVSWYSQVNDDHTRKLMFRMYLFIVMRQRNYKDSLATIQKLLKTPGLLPEVKVEMQYYLAIFALRNENFNLAYRAAQEVHEHNPEFRELSKLRRFIDYMDLTIHDSDGTFHFDDLFKDATRELLPDDLVYNMSGFRNERGVNFDKYFNLADDGAAEVKDEFAPLTVDAVSQKYSEISKEDFLQFCYYAMDEIGYETMREVDDKGESTVTFYTRNQQNASDTALFAFHRLHDEASISDIFIENFQNLIKQEAAAKGFIVTNARLTSGAEDKLAKMNHIRFIGPEDIPPLFQNWHTSRIRD